MSAETWATMSTSRKLWMVLTLLVIVAPPLLFFAGLFDSDTVLQHMLLFGVFVLAVVVNCAVYVYTLISKK